MSIFSCFINRYAKIPSKNNKITALTIFTIATVFPLLEIPKANPRKIRIGIKYASNPKIPNIIFLIPADIEPPSPITHKNIKIATAKIAMSITSFLTALSTFFLAEDLFLLLVPVLVLFVLFDAPFLVLFLPFDALFPDADVMIFLPLNEFYMIL